MKCKGRVSNTITWLRCVFGAILPFFHWDAMHGLHVGGLSANFLGHKKGPDYRDTANNLIESYKEIRCWMLRNRLLVFQFWLYSENPRQEIMSNMKSFYKTKRLWKLGIKYVEMKTWIQITSGCCTVTILTRKSCENHMNEEFKSYEYHIMVFVKF